MVLSSSHIQGRKSVPVLLKIQHNQVCIHGEWMEGLPIVRIDRTHCDRAQSASMGSFCPAPCVLSGSGVNSVSLASYKKATGNGGLLLIFSPQAEREGNS